MILQSRVRITVDGEARYIRECVPDTAGTEVSSTTEGCDDPSEWTHDLTAGVSYGQERFYFVHNGKREYVTDCVDSDVTYIHDVTVAGYRHHDDRRFSHALSKVTIEAPSGEHVIVDGVVLPGAPQVPYEWLREALVPAGAPSYSGCEKTEPRDRIECWRRPSVAPPPETMARGDCDGSEYRRTLGPGEAVVTADVCTAQVSASWTLIDGSPVTHADGPCCGWENGLWRQSLSKLPQAEQTGVQGAGLPSLVRISGDDDAGPRRRRRGGHGGRNREVRKFQHVLREYAGRDVLGRRDLCGDEVARQQGPGHGGGPHPHRRLGGRAGVEVMGRRHAGPEGGLSPSKPWPIFIALEESPDRRVRVDSFLGLIRIFVAITCSGMAESVKGWFRRR